MENDKTKEIMDRLRLNKSWTLVSFMIGVPPYFFLLKPFGLTSQLLGLYAQLVGVNIAAILAVDRYYLKKKYDQFNKE